MLEVVFVSGGSSNSEATFAEIEQAGREQRRRLMGKALEVLINGRDTGLQAAPPGCPECGAEMEFHEYRGKTIRGLEGEARFCAKPMRRPRVTESQPLCGRCEPLASCGSLFNLTPPPHRLE